MSSDTLLGIRVFCRVVELQSFAAAARQLGMSPAMVSKHVMHLERRLGSRLLNRSSRHLSLTESGRVYHAKAQPLLEELDGVEAAVSGAARSPSGTLRITAPDWFANPHFTRLLARFQSRCPDIRLDVNLNGHMVNVVEEGFDVALRVARMPGDSWITRQLSTVRFLFVAAPAYLRRVGIPRSLEELTKASLLLYSLAPTREIFNRDAQRKAPLPVVSPLQSPNESLLHLAALEGMGFALLPDRLVGEDIRTGRLVLVLPDHRSPPLPILGIYPNRRQLSFKVRCFLDFMVEEERAVHRELAPAALRSTASRAPDGERSPEPRSN